MRFHTSTDQLVHDGIKGLAMPALDSQKVPGPIRMSLFAIVARNVHDATQFRRHGLHGNPRRHGIPGGLHAFPRLGRLFANGTTGIVGGQLPKAIPMNGVSAGHLVRGGTTAKEEFLTDGTIRLVFSSLAIVFLVQGLVDAHAAIVAMLKVLGSADATKTALRAVVGLIFIRHP